MLAVGALAAIAGIGVAAHRSKPGRASVAVERVRRHVVRLSPPAPIPGYLLIADRGNNRMLLVDAAKRILWRYPAPGTSPPMAFRYDDDTFFGPKRDRIVSNQEGQHTIEIVSFPGGRLLWRYGHVDTRGAAPGYLNTPDDAYLLPSGLVSVADAYNCRVLFIDRAHHVVRSYGRAGDCRHAPPAALGPINGATPLADGGTLVSEIPGSWVDDIGPTGRLRWAVQAPVSYPSDPQLLAPGRILLADYARPGHALIMNTHGRVLWRYGPASGPGALDHPSLAFRVAPGLIGINDDYRDRVVIVDMHTNKIVWQYGHTDQPGRAAGYLRTPDGLDLLPTADAQRSPVLRALLTPKRRSPTRAGALPAQPTSRLTIAAARFRLPAPVERAVAVASGRTILIAGGLDAAGSSTNGVFRLDPSSGNLTALGSTPQPFHDAAAAMIGGALYVFGGGSASSSAAVQRFDPPTRRGSVVGRLPHPLSDLVSATIGGTVYLVGGYDGVAPRREIYATTDGTRFRVVARLPHGIRYPAVAAVGGKLVVAGGIEAAGPSNAVYIVDPSTGLVRGIGSLPAAIGHAAAVTFNGVVYVIGGVDAAGRTVSTVTEISGARVARISGAAGSVADAAVVQLDGAAYLVGGRLHDRAVARTLVVTPR